MDRFDPRSLAKKNEGQKIAETKIPEGKGLALGNHPKVMKNITKEENRDLKVIFGVLFGHKKVKLKDVKVLLKKWNGWETIPPQCMCCPLFLIRRRCKQVLN